MLRLIFHRSPDPVGPRLLGLSQRAQLLRQNSDRICLPRLECRESVKSTMPTLFRLRGKRVYAASQGTKARVNARRHTFQTIDGAPQLTDRCVRNLAPLRRGSSRLSKSPEMLRLIFHRSPDRICVYA